MIDELYLEKVKIYIKVILLDGTELEGYLFLSPTSRYHQRRESVEEFMNAHSPFFILMENDKVHFINKSYIKYLTIRNKEEISFVKTEYTKESSVDIHFISGDRIKCIIPYEPQIYRPRLSDFLSEIVRFFYVIMDNELLLVSRDSIRSINEV